MEIPCTSSVISGMSVVSRKEDDRIADTDGTVLIDSVDLSGSPHASPAISVVDDASLKEAAVMASLKLAPTASEEKYAAAEALATAKPEVRREKAMLRAKARARLAKRKEAKGGGKSVRSKRRAKLEAAAEPMTPADRMADLMLAPDDPAATSMRLTDKFRLAKDAIGEATSCGDVSALVTLTKSKDARVRLKALDLMCPCQVKLDVPEFWDAVFDLAEDDDSSIRSRVLHIICDGSPPRLESRVIDTLESVFNRDSDKAIRRYAHKVLGIYRRTGKWNVL